MTPKLEAVKTALERMDKASPYSFGFSDVQKDFLAAAIAAGFDPKRAAEDWARYQVAVGESAEQLAEVEEPEPEQEGLFG